MRKRSQLQKKIQRSTNHQTKENELNQIKEIKNLKMSINMVRNLRETIAIAAIKKNSNFYKFLKNNSTVRAGIGPLQDEEGNLEPSNRKMSELLNEQYNSVFSTPDPTMTIKYSKDSFGQPQGNTLSDINIIREDIIDAIKTISQNSSGGTDEFPAVLLKQCSKSIAHPLPLLYKASLKTGKLPIDLKRAIISPIYKGGSRNLPKNYRPVALTSDNKNTVKNINKKYPPLPRNASENEPQATWLSLWQILPLNKYWQILPLNKYWQILPLNKYWQILPLNKYCQILPLNKYWQILPLNKNKIFD